MAPQPRTPRQWELDALRVFAIAGVVMIHVSGLLLAHDDLIGTARRQAAVAVNVGLTWVVPVFVMISGALTLSPRAHADGPVAFYRKRFARILPALLVWHVIYLVVVRLWMRGEPFHPRVVVVGLLDAKMFTALYFLWLIAGLYVIAPVIAAFLAGGGRRRAFGVAGVALLWTQLVYALSTLSSLLGEPRPIHLGAWTQWWPYVGLFVAGWALRDVVLRPVGLVIASVVGCAAVAEPIWQYGVHGPRALVLLPITRLGPMMAVAAISFFLVAIGLGARLTPGPGVAVVLRRLSDAAFGVFLVHLLILEVLKPAVPTRSLWALAGAFVVTLAASFMISLVAGRIRYLRMIF
ncbi:acyltransferase family protein [Actinoplanes sp. NPDC089786]|uniref:acyltransferase n=1 Tax=Actinoplanes sp. NPDC089786 TaxID=3155185 RepID=UPI00343B467D